MAEPSTDTAGHGFTDHGVATPISNHRGIVATADGEGRNVVLVWLFDHRGGYALLVIDAQTGKSEEIPMPFPPGGDCPFSSILSSRNRFYTHFNSHFTEFDPERRAFTFTHETAPQMAMGMTEDDDGRIWSVTYPSSGVVSFNPETGEFRDYGHVHEENWSQYQRSVAADDAGWIYFALGNTACDIIAFDPVNGEATALLPDAERVIGTSGVFRDINGKVYGLPAEGGEDGWYELSGGRAEKVGRLKQRREKPIITSSQGLFHRDFPNGHSVVDCDLVERVLTVKDARTGDESSVSFDYTTDGAHLMGVAAAPDGTVCGGTAFPMRFFAYDPCAQTWTNREALGQCNTVARQGDRFFVGGYTHGFLLEWDPATAWVKTERGSRESNPRFLTECEPSINRPHCLLAHPDGKTVIMAGTPGYGYTGGGILFWDREARRARLIEHEAILPQHSTMSMVALPDGKLLGGSTTDAGTGGETKVSEAQLYVMDIASGLVEWHGPVLPGVQSYTDMCRAPDGLVYGLADTVIFFVFDTESRTIVCEENIQERLGPIAYQQGQRKILRDGDGTVCLLFLNGIARVDPATHRPEMVVESPVPIQAGGDILDGRIYFGSSSHLWSCPLPSA